MGYWITVIYYLGWGKHIPPHFIILEALLNIFRKGGWGGSGRLLVKNTQYQSEYLIHNNYIITLTRKTQIHIFLSLCSSYHRNGVKGNGEGGGNR
jgi:hypothetical protein